jgi:hypothetical protein
MKKFFSRVCIGGLIMLSACNPSVPETSITIKQPLEKICSQKNQEVLSDYGLDLQCGLFNKHNASIILNIDRGKEIMFICSEKDEKTTCTIIKNTLF